MNAMAKLTLLIAVLNVLALSGKEVTAGTLPEFPASDTAGPVFQENTEINTRSKFESKNLPQSHVGHISESNNLNLYNKTSGLLPGQVHTEEKNKGQSIKTPETESHRRVQTGNTRKLSSKRNSAPKHRTAAAVNSNKKVKEGTTNGRQGRSKNQTTSKPKTSEHKRPVATGNSIKKLNENDHTAGKVFDQKLSTEGKSQTLTNTESDIAKTNWSSGTGATKLNKNRGGDNDAKQVQGNNFGTSFSGGVISDMKNDFENNNTLHLGSFEGSSYQSLHQKVNADEETARSYEINPVTKYIDGSKEKLQNFQSNLTPEHKDSIAFSGDVGIDDGKSVHESLNKENENQAKVATNTYPKIDEEKFTEEVFVSAIPAAAKVDTVRKFSGNEKLNTEFGETSNKKLIDMKSDYKFSFDRASDPNFHQAAETSKNTANSFTGEHEEKFQNFQPPEPKTELSGNVNTDIDKLLYKSATKEQVELFKEETGAYPKTNEEKWHREEIDSFIPNITITAEKIGKSKNKAKDSKEASYITLKNENEGRTESFDSSATEPNQSLTPDSLAEQNHSKPFDGILYEKEGQVESDLKKNLEHPIENPFSMLVSYGDRDNASNSYEKVDTNKRLKDLIETSPVTKFTSELEEKSQRSFLTDLISKPQLKYSFLSSDFLIFDGSSDVNFNTLLDKIIHEIKKNQSAVDTSIFIKPPNEKITIGEFTLAFATYKNINKTDNKIEDSSEHLLGVLEDLSLTTNKSENAYSSWLLSTSPAKYNNTTETDTFANGKGNFSLNIKTPAKESHFVSDLDTDFNISGEKPQSTLVYAESTSLPEENQKTASQFNTSSVTNFEYEKNVDNFEPPKLTTDSKKSSFLAIDGYISSDSSINTDLPISQTSNEEKKDHSQVEIDKYPDFTNENTDKSKFGGTYPNPDTTFTREINKESESVPKFKFHDKPITGEKSEIPFETTSVTELNFENSFKNSDSSNPNEQLDESIYDTTDVQSKVEISTYPEFDQEKSTKESYTSGSKSQNNENFRELSNEKLRDDKHQRDSQAKFFNTKNEWTADTDETDFNKNTAHDISIKQTNLSKQEGQISSDFEFSDKKPYNIEGYENERTASVFATNPASPLTSQHEDESQNFEPSESTTDLAEYEDFTTFDDTVSSSTDKSLNENFYEENEGLPKEEINTYPKSTEIKLNEQELASVLPYTDTTATVKEFSKNENPAGDFEEIPRNKNTGEHVSQSESFINTQYKIDRNDWAPGPSTENNQALSTGATQLNRNDRNRLNGQAQINNYGTSFHTSEGGLKTDFKKDSEFLDDKPEKLLSYFRSSNSNSRDEAISNKSVDHVDNPSSVKFTREHGRKPQSLGTPDSRKAYAVKSRDISGTGSSTLSKTVRGVSSKGRKSFDVELNNKRLGPTVVEARK